MPSKQALLAEALASKQLVTLTRSLEEGFVDGYVLDVGPRFFLIALLADEKRFNGFECFRVSDIRKLQVPARQAKFSEQALKIRRERRPKKPRVSLATLEDLLTSASRCFPLITIHREKADPGACHIGRVVDIVKGRVNLLEIDPGATWHTEPQGYRLSDITRVDFGGGYEEALHLVGGIPPS